MAKVVKLVGGRKLQIKHGGGGGVFAGIGHKRLHEITSPLDHLSAAIPGRILQADANGMPVNATNTDAQVAAAVTASHARQHSATSASDHSAATGADKGKYLHNDPTSGAIDWQPASGAPDVQTKQLFVDVNGNDTTGDGTIEKPFLTIQKAHDVADVRSLINIGVGVFSENLAVSKGQILFRGRGRIQTIIRGEITLGGVADYCGFVELALTTQVLSGPRTALSLLDCTDVTLRRCDIRCNNDAGSMSVFTDNTQIQFIGVEAPAQALNPIAITLTNGSIGLFRECIIAAVDVDAGSTIQHKDLVFDRANSALAGTEDRLDVAENILNDSFVSGVSVKDAIETLALDSFGVVIDGGTVSPTTGSKGFRVVPYACTITGWEILADASGSAVVDVKMSTYAAFPATASIAGAEKPTLAAAQKNQNLALTLWTTGLLAGDILEFNLDSVATCKRVTVTLFVTRT